MRCALLLCLCLATPAFAELPAAPPLIVRGDGLTAAAGGLSLPELTALGPVTVSFEIHGKRHSAVGVPLAKVLARFGVGPGPMSKAMAPSEKRAGYKKVVVASAPDGFQAVFSIAELTPEMGATQVLVAWQMDGQPLGPDTGPLRLVVPTDKEPSRCLHHLQRLDVVDLRRVVPPQKGG